MQTSRLRAALLVVAWAALLLPSTLLAQAVTGVGDDATMPHKGELRFSVSSMWKAWYERYGQGTPGRPNGSVEPLGVDFNLDTIGIPQLENLAPVQSSVRSLAGMPAFTASLGSALVSVHDNVLSTPLGLELGLANRLSVSVMVPFVTATSRVNFLMNPTGLEPTLGFNPATIYPGALTADAVFLAQFDSASAQLSRSIAQCTANPATPGCGPINANPAGARALVANGTSFASGLAQVYGGRPAGAGYLFVPIEGTPAQAAIEAKVAAFRAMYAAYGNTALTGAGPIGAQTPMTAADMQAVLADSMYGVNAKPLATSITRGIGDIDLGVKMNLFDSFHGNDSARFAPTGFNWRQSVGWTFRLGTGTLPPPGDFTAIGTGDHANAFELRSFTDLIFGRHLWFALVASYAAQTTGQVILRIPDSPTQVILASYRQETVQRRLGNTFDLQVNPHWALNEFLSLSGQYYYRRKAADEYRGTFDVTDLNGTSVTLDAAMLGAYTEAEEHRVGVGATYSTVAAVERQKKGLAFDVSFFHYETTLGSLGRVPKISVDQVAFRVYQRLFGH
jgi:hypothetical protein